MEEFLEFTRRADVFSFPLLMFLLKVAAIVAMIVALLVLIYDRFVQRENQLLINYPLIGRLRYFFYLIRDPMRQYFGDEKFYESFDKVKWVYDAAEGRALLASFSPGQPIATGIFGLKNASRVLNEEEVDRRFWVTFGEVCETPFRSRSIIGRSAMSDGAISPEATRAFAKGAYLGGFPINTGEGSLTTNFFYTHRCDPRGQKWFEYYEGTWFAKSLYYLFGFFFNDVAAVDLYRALVLPKKEAETFLFDRKHMACFRVDWSRPLSDFPETVLEDLPDIVFQIGSGLYGVRDGKGEFDEVRYEKVMRFCRMSEIKLAQGAKQTGGKLLAVKVTDAIAYYRGVEPHEDLFSPDRFPYYDSVAALFDFLGKLKTLSGKPAGIKLVISSREGIDPIVEEIRVRVESGSQAYPDFLTIDGGDGGSGAAPLETMMRVGLPIQEAIHIADRALRDAGVREKVKLIGSEKVLTPDDVVVLKALGADLVGIARGFMMSAGCIRARECSGAGGRHCPVGLATQDRRRRASFLVEQKSRHIARYHERLVDGVVGLLAVMGKHSIDEVERSDLFYKDPDGYIYDDIEDYFRSRLHLSGRRR
ncbi:FMN-binding glutamate synthase family protein [Hydrogenimonas cancrithermarum]|uniref:Glutamate synthase domain-containing protein n=1 Tax=Hydrogenimonas cancrithermarum TaxID=2993563 RepID=A0ABM8FJH5_9BACT|nr:FMN-binding glutamate synthase family protein [Hydrogenimonas cancrithermarum]BDY12447.1 hypothetical protein HCR_07590 [Hydrogenimonas cancrithermarum]